MKASIRRMSMRTLALGLLVTAGICTMGVAAAIGADPPKQKGVVPQAQAAPGSGKGIAIGYATNLEAVPIVHVISEGIRAQAERAGVNLIFCDGNGDNATALNCMKLFKEQGVQGILNSSTTRRRRRASAPPGQQGVPVFAIDIPQPPCQTSFMGVDNAYGGRRR